MSSGPIDILPLWVLFGVTIAAVLLSIEAGFRLGRYRRERATTGAEAEGPVGATVGATLGLLAFLLGFTFSLAASYFENRRELVLAEANAIGTTFLRAEMLAEPSRAEVRGLLREYVQVRLDAFQSSRNDQALTRSEDLQRQLWSRAVTVGEKNSGSIVVGLFIQSLNETIDLHAKRVSANLRVRIPVSIWSVLYLITLFAMAALGYHEGLAGKRRSYVTLALACAFSAVILLIADLDRPQEGLLRLSQQPLLDLQASMKASVP